MELIHNELRKYKLICFSADNFSDPTPLRGYAKPRMWALYGNMHRGCCLVFQRDIFEKVLSSLKFEFVRGKEVAYGHLSDRPTFVVPEEPYLLDSIKEFVRSNIDWFLYSKNKDWENEDEIRYIIYSENETEYIPIRSSLVGIVFGSKTPYHNRLGILEHFDNCESTVLKWKNGSASYTSIYTSYYDYIWNQLKIGYLFLLNEIHTPGSRNVSFDTNSLLLDLGKNDNVNVGDFDFLNNVDRLLRKNNRENLGEMYEKLRLVNQKYKVLTSRST